MTIETPRFPSSHWENSADLMVDLMQNKTPRPFWVQFQGYSICLTDDRAELIAKGLAVALEFDLSKNNR